MKIVLRKKDSVTSIVLFIFNIYGQILGSYSIKLNHLIEFMLKFGKSETSVRMGLSRMVKSGVLVNRNIDNEVFYELTKEGLTNITIWNTGWERFFERYSRRNIKWEGNWYLLTLMDFNKSEKNNLFIVEELTELSMREVNKDLWISPYNLSHNIKNLFEGRDHKYLEFWGQLHSSIDIDDLLSLIFDIKHLQKQYSDFIDSIAAEEITINGKEGSGELLPILFDLGWRFYDIATSDPVLPLNLLCNWAGDRAAKEMQEKRACLFKHIEMYFKQTVL